MKTPGAATTGRLDNMCLAHASSLTDPPVGVKLFLPEVLRQFSTPFANAFRRDREILWVAERLARGFTNDKAKRFCAACSLRIATSRHHDTLIANRF